MDIVREMYFLKDLLKDEVYIIPESKRYPLLVLISHSGEDYIPVIDEDFLEKILQSVQLKLPEIKLVNILKSYTFFETLKEVTSGRVIAFDTDLQQINISLVTDKYFPKIQEGICFLAADSLSAIATDKEKKKLLWQALQKMFL